LARRLVAAALVALALGIAVPAARADGDPASDYLLTKPLFVPQDDGVPSANVNQLTSVLADARARGYTIRVALIGTRYDMGSVYALWKIPKTYARFLGQELKFLYKGRLLVVMPNGLATSTGGLATPRDQAVVDTIPAPGADGAAMANAAARAVQKLAAQSGVVVALPPLSSPKGSSANSDRVKIIVGAAALVVLGAAAFWGRRRLARHKLVG
jgi:MYXO-CTERM domain-containing protein